MQDHASSDCKATVFSCWSCQHQTLALRFWNWVAELPRRFKPQVHGLADVLKSLFLSVTVGRASWKLGNLGHKGVVFVAPVDDDLVFVH